MKDWTVAEFHAGCVIPCLMTSPDPILDAEGHNKPLRRRGVFSPAETQALTTALGIRCVVYRDTSGSLPYIDAYGKLTGVDYIFVKGYNGRISTVGLLPPYYPEQSADVARKIRGILNDEAGRQERNRKVALRSVVSAMVGVYDKVGRHNDTNSGRNVELSAHLDEIRSRGIK